MKCPHCKNDNKKLFTITTKKVICGLCGEEFNYQEEPTEDPIFTDVMEVCN